MELHQLRCLVALAGTGHPSRAAEQCGVSPPSLRQQITKLEKELGGRLFRHLKGRSVPTDAGKALVQRAVRILSEVDAARRDVAGDSMPETGGKATPQASLASDAKYRMLYETMRDAFVSVDMEGRILEFNSAYQDMLGYSADELRERTYVELTPQKWHATEAGIVAEQILPHGFSGVYEKEYRRKDGTVFPIELRTFLMRDSEDRPSAMWAIVRDITERKATETALAHLNTTLEHKVAERTAALRESERMARAVVDGLTAHIAIVDEAGIILSVNERWRNFARENDGTPLSVGEGANYLQTCAASARSGCAEAGEVAAGIREVLTGKRPHFAVEYPCHSPTAQRWFIVQVTPFPGGGPPRALVAHENITTRKQAEQALRASEERYRQLMHGLPVAMHTCDVHGRIALYNAAAVNLWGREPDTRRDRWCGAQRAFTADGRRLTKERCPVALSMRLDEPIRNTELIIERPDGSRSHVLVFPDPTHDSTGAVVGAVVIQVEITALKTAENALRTSERKLRTLARAVEQSPASVLITDPSGRIDYVNAKFTEDTGYALEEVLGRNPRLLKSGGQSSAIYRKIWKSILAGRDWRGELCNRKKSGELFWVFAVIAPILDEHGAVTHFVELMEDITERRQAAAVLRDREERLSAILNTVADAIIAIDRSGTITSVNPATARIFGYTEAEMLGQNVRLLMPSPDREQHDRYLQNYHRTSEARIIGIGREAQARRRDGTIFPVDLAVSEVREMQLFIGVIRDISRRKQLEAEVLRIAEEERQRVAADLHDGIGQELVAIQCLSHALRRDLEMTHHAAVGQARRIEEAIIGAIGDTRQLARGMNPVVRDGSGLMHALRRLVETTARTHRIPCSFHCAAPVSIENPTAANELYRIAQEAMHNAIRHGRPKRITVRLSKAAGEVRLTVLDNGRGLPADLSKAPGMGLRVMHYRAAMIGGQLSIQPRRHGGTAVICQLPKPFTKP